MNHKQYAESGAPHYMRFRIAGFAGIRYDWETGESAFALDQADVDVSWDGEIWWHLLGPRCIDSLPEYRIVGGRKQAGSGR